MNRHRNRLAKIEAEAHPPTCPRCGQPFNVTTGQWREVIGAMTPDERRRARTLAAELRELTRGALNRQATGDRP